MFKLDTHFEQVPVERVLKIATVDAPKSDEQANALKKHKPDKKVVTKRDT